MKVELITVAAMLILAPHLAEAGQESNGGDILSIYLRQTRAAITKTLQFLKGNPKADLELCKSNLTPDGSTKQADCREFLLSSLDQLLAVSLDEVDIPIEVRSAEGMPNIQNPDGSARPVDATTTLDAKGAILFNYAANKNHTPTELFTLLAYELGHKVLFRGQYTGDYPPAGAFTRGMDLLGASAQALTAAAEQQGRISKFQVYDHFVCKVSEGFADETPSFHDAEALRVFAESDRFDAYDLGFGGGPDLPPVLRGGKSESFLTALDLEVHEGSGCSTNVDVEKTFTLARLLHVQSTGPEQFQVGQAIPSCIATPEENCRDMNHGFALEHRLQGLDPTCQTPGGSPFLRLTSGELLFECSYLGSAGR